jgi:heat shock protein HtpX
MSVSLYLRMTMLFFVLTGLLMVLGYVVGWYFGDPLTFMLIGLVIAAVVNFASYFFSDTVVIKMARARIIQESENPTLFGIVRKVSQEAGIPMPKVGIVDRPQPNAFATGRGPHKAVVVATSGILNTLTPNELEAVIGHEIGHVVHRDILISSVAATIAGVVSYLGNIALWSMWGTGARGRQGNGGIVTLLMASILVPLGATFVRLGISRSFELNADEYGARLTRNPGALITALDKISTRAKTQNIGRNRGQSTSASTASMWIINPFQGHSLVELFSTHPSTQKRISRLRRIAEEMGVYVP